MVERLSPEHIGVVHESGPMPFSWTDERQYTEDSSTTVFTWDIDKTYLATRTDTASDLIRTFLEFAVDKEVSVGLFPLKSSERGDTGGVGRPSILFPLLRCKCETCFSERCPRWRPAR